LRESAGREGAGEVGASFRGDTEQREPCAKLGGVSASEIEQDDTDFVFATLDGSPMLHRNMTRRVWAKAVERAGLGDEGYDLHHLRHSFASVLISQGHDVVFVSHQLGHATPVITLGTYSHLFDARDKAKQARDALEAEFGALIAMW
jgi:integrase